MPRDDIVDALAGRTALLEDEPLEETDDGSEDGDSIAEEGSSLSLSGIVPVALKIQQMQLVRVSTRMHPSCA